MKRIHLALATTLSLVSLTPTFATVTPLSQARRVSTFVSFTPSGGSMISSTDAMDAPGFGPWSEDAFCHVEAVGGQVTSTAVMTSTLDANGVVASATSQTVAEISNPADFAEGVGFSNLTYVFTVDTVTPCRLHGIATARERGLLNVIFRVNGGAILLILNPRDTSLAIDEAFTLTPGTYRLEVDTSGFGQAFQDQNFEAFAQYDVELSFPTAASVEPLVSRNAVRAAPNPMLDETRLTFAEPSTEARVLDIVDASGRVVRRLGLRAGGSVVWDGRDTNGSSLAGGVYFVRSEGSSPTRVVLIR